MDKLIIALGPAFASGFAVQRLIEILDPLIPSSLSEQRKKTILGLVTLACGFGIAGYLNEVRVIRLLGIQGADVLDFLVTGLIISSGTEGFNSILKFLSYKKEEKKAEAVAEKVNASRAFQSINRLNAVPTNLAPEAVNVATMEDAPTLEEALETSLKNEIKNMWASQFVAATWKKQPFSDYTNDPDDPKAVVFRATKRVADDRSIALTNASANQLQSQVDLGTKAKDALVSMRQALI